MAIDKTLRLKVEAELSMGKTPRELELKYGIPYVTIVGWRKKLDEVDSDIETLKTVDIATIHTVVNKLKEEAPHSVEKKLDAIATTMSSLDTLDQKFHTVVLNLLTAAETMSRDKDLSIRDWKMLGDGIGTLYANIFNKSGVNVNVMNQTNVSGEKMSLFKGSMRG